MNHLTVVVAQKDQVAAERLAQMLRGRCKHVAIALSKDEVQQAILKTRANAAIVDLELLEDDQLQDLCQEYPSTAIVATHRSPDEEMWMACLESGAADCCYPGDVDGVLRAITQNTRSARAARAA
jgi:ActR/RegA family two-component response regulator